jgi:endo-1,4-beta-xylanase
MLYSSGGSAAMTFSSHYAGNYAMSWSNVNDVVGGTGWSTGGYMTVGYNVGAANGYNNISIYGWTTNPLVEYYICEFGSVANGSYKGSMTSDGHVYNTYEHTQYNQPSIQGTQTFNQYLDNWGGARTGSNGQVTTGNHFSHWNSLGMNMGSFNIMVLGTESYGGGSGYVNATVW